MPKGLKGFQKGHKTFLTKEDYIKIGNKARGKKREKRQLNTGRTHFKIGHGMNKREENPSWKGGKYKSKDGYCHIRLPNHSLANNCGYVLEHRLIMFNHIKRPFSKGEIVHHLNGNKSDNRLENLSLMSAGGHTRLHCFNQKQHVCLICNTSFSAPQGAPRKFCSMLCYRTYRKGRPIIRT